MSGLNKNIDSNYCNITNEAMPAMLCCILTVYNLRRFVT
jgi:hypothetical protein